MSGTAAATTECTTTTTAGHQHQTGRDGNVNKRKITSSPERDYLHNTLSIPNREIAINTNPTLNSR